MGRLGGTALKLCQTVLYAIEFCAAGIVLGIYSWFLWWLHHNHVGIPTWEKAVEGLSGAACLYLIFAVVLTCCLGGITFFAFLAILLDVLFCGAFIAIAVMTRDGADSCSKNTYVHTPIGNGRGSTDIKDATDLSFACRLNKVAFAVSIIGAGLFAVSALIQLAIGRNHQKEKRFGPSPKNNYTSGSGTRWFSRRRGPKTTRDAYAKDAETGIVGDGATGLTAPDNTTMRPSADTGYTGSTMGNNNPYVHDKYNTPAMPTHGGYHTAPTGTGVNPYGYDNTARPTNF
ncbi:hypothetical protein NA57DRAFT_55967 [Rhizodiscina lignyota]|uniref:MARVEL domain-containing protein n=1 Tax=Rhizodiscina lignyota TaxID=1504668 RepID=A0A9P4IKW8_9PEZI|nr:hypothetical protein NA57DRAFT_55967 [Rhizodiscina lignyota]